MHRDAEKNEWESHPMATGKATKAQREQRERDDATAGVIREQLVTWEAGRYAQMVQALGGPLGSYGPACICGKRVIEWTSEGGGKPNGICYRHPKMFVPAGGE
jgi:hypothetical protein